MLAKDLWENAMAMYERREMLCCNTPTCPACLERKQIQLTDWSTNPAKWKCRICWHKFTYEPDLINKRSKT